MTLVPNWDTTRNAGKAPLGDQRPMSNEKKTATTTDDAPVTRSEFGASVNALTAMGDAIRELTKQVTGRPLTQQQTMRADLDAGRAAAHVPATPSRYAALIRTPKGVMLNLIGTTIMAEGKDFLEAIGGAALPAEISSGGGCVAVVGDEVCGPLGIVGTEIGFFKLPEAGRKLLCDFWLRKKVPDFETNVHMLASAKREAVADNANSVEVRHGTWIQYSDFLRRIGPVQKGPKSVKRKLTDLVRKSAIEVVGFHPIGESGAPELTQAAWDALFDAPALTIAEVEAHVAEAIASAAS
jgi:hypothetical protein